MRNYLIHSQYFVALCAALLGAETFLVGGVPISIHTSGVLFFAALFIYNASRLNLALVKNPSRNLGAVRVEGPIGSIITCAVSLLVLFALLTACTWEQLVVFAGASLLSLCYMMPFKWNGKRITGLRNRLWLKNIILSLTWSLATVLLPLASGEFSESGSAFVFMFARRFFFIYSLTVVYDLRDLEADGKAGLNTIALRFGENRTRLISMGALALFVVFTLTDPFLDTHSMRPLATALLWSAAVASVIVLTTSVYRHQSWYAVMVDSAMVWQFLLVLVYSFV